MMHLKANGNMQEHFRRALSSCPRSSTSFSYIIDMRYNKNENATSFPNVKLIFFFVLKVCLFLIVISSVSLQMVRAEIKKYDVVVVGAGTSGLAAGIQAARMGVDVAIIEETDWIGGQMAAAGVSNMDEGVYPPVGIYKEFLDKIRNYYQSLTPPKKIGTCYFSNESNCFEPAIAKKILAQMIEETIREPLGNGQFPVLDLFLMTKVDSVGKEGKVVKSIITADGTKFEAKIVIDATEYGDVIPMTGSRYRVGNLNSDQIKSPSFDIDDPKYKDACIQSITYSAIIKKYPNGIPEQLRIKMKPPGYNEEINKLFSSLVTEHGSEEGGLWSDGVLSWNRHSAYRGMPNRSSDAPDAEAGSEQGWARISKTGLNFANDYPWLKNYSKDLYADLPDPYPLSAKYLIDESFRNKINCEAKLRTLQFMYYIQNELDQPWSVAVDEGYGGDYNVEENICQNIPASRLDLKTIEKYMPVMPYVRESIRIIGLHTLTAKEIKRIGYNEENTAPFRAKKHFNDSVIAVGDYAVDLHGAESGENLESYLGETKKDKPKWRYGPFHVPFESLIPEAVDGLIAAEKNISATRLASAAIRLQPVSMRVGQAAGIIAALAVENGIQPRQINPIAVQWKLLENGVPLLIIDESPKNGFLDYTDVPREHQFWKYIQMVGLRGLMGGVGEGRFGVDDASTKLQIIDSLAELYAKTISGQSRQTARPIQNFYKTMRKMALSTYMKMKAYLSEPYSSVTRGQFAEFLATWLKLRPLQDRPTPLFSDVPKNHKFFRSVQLVSEHNLIPASGTDKNNNRLYLPEKEMTRGETAVVLTSVMQKLGIF